MKWRNSTAARNLKIVAILLVPTVLFAGLIALALGESYEAIQVHRHHVPPSAFHFDAPPYRPPKPVVKKVGDFPDDSVMLLTPVKLATDVRKAVAADLMSCYITNEGALFCLDGDFTRDTSGKTGDDRVFRCRKIDTDVEDVAVGLNHIIYVKHNGDLFGVGDNKFCQLGEQGKGHFNTPVRIAGNVKSVAAMENSSFFIDRDGTLHGMGLNNCGQLGEGPNRDHYDPLCITKKIVELDHDVISVACGRNSILFVKKTGVLFAMGANNKGQLGTDQKFLDPDGDKNGRGYVLTIDCIDGVDENGNGYARSIDGTNCFVSHPVKVTDNVKCAAAGWDSNFYVTKDGKLITWGDNLWFRYFHHMMLDTAFEKLFLADDVDRISAMSFNIMFLTKKGTLYAIGMNEHGQFGNGTKKASYTPVFVAGGVKDFSVGGSHSLFVTNDGTLYGMGDATLGVFGRDFSKEAAETGTK